MMILRFILCLLILSGVLSFSTPGDPIKPEYARKERIPVYANELDSVKTQLNFEYYFLKFCQPGRKASVEQGLEGKLFGKSTQSTPYIVQMEVSDQCQRLCRMDLNAEDIENFAWMIDNKYRANLVIDNLPARSQNEWEKSETGFPIGLKNHKSQYFIHNHLTFKIEYEETYQRIAGFNIVPKSIAATNMTSGYCDLHAQVSESKLPLQKLEAGVPVFFSYDVEFIKARYIERSRLDTYKDLGNEEIHYFNILNSGTIVLILTLVIYHTLRNALGLHQELETRENIERDLKWKELSKDVFRPPGKPLLLTALIGTGVQIGTMLVLALILSCLGFLVESNLFTIMLFLYALMGVFAGYYSSKLYKMFGGSEWIKCASWTAVLHPSVNLLIFSLVKGVFLFGKSSNALAPVSMSALIAVWLGISMPLVFLGSWIGYKKPTIKNPCRFSEIGQPIKSQPWWVNPVTLCILAGLLPFGAIFIELTFVMKAIWLHSFYYFAGFLFTCLLLQAITSAQISIVITYVQLSQGNHRVWWNSFLSTGSIGLYIFGYSIFYYATELDIASFSSSILYFGCMLAISLLFSLFCGSVGFFASHWFTRKIYGTLRTNDHIELDEQKSPESFGYETFVEESTI